MATLQLKELISDILHEGEGLIINPSGKELNMSIRNVDSGLGIVEVSFEGSKNTFHIEEQEIVSFSISELNSELTIKNTGTNALWVDWF